MASQNIARLGVVLGIDTAEFTAGIEQAIRKNKELTSIIRSDSNAAAKEILALKYATDNYNKTLTKTEEIEYRISKGNLIGATDKLKQELLAQAKAYDAVAASAKKANEAKMAGMVGKDSTALNRQQIAALGYQTTDIITGLAGGQNPLLILIQQGGQLRDQFGGVANVFKAFAQVLTFTRVVVGGVTAVLGGMAYGIYKGHQELKEFNNTLALTNNYAGVSRDAFLALANVTATKVNMAVSDTRDIYKELLASGKFTKESIGSVGEAIAKVAKLSGEDADVVAKQLIPAFNGTASAAASLNEKYRFLNVEQYKRIEQLEKEGNYQKAAKELADALNKSLDEQAKKAGIIAKTWMGIKDIITGIGDALARIGADPTGAERIAAAEKGVRIAKTLGTPDIEKVRKAEEYLEKVKKEVAEEEKIRIESAKKIQDSQKELEARKKAGGIDREINLEFEARKQSIEKEAQLRMQSANEFKRIEVEAWKEKELAKLQLEQRFREVGYGLATQERQALAAKLLAIDEKAEQKKLEISRLRYREIEQRQTSEADSVQKEKEKLELYRENIFLSDTDYKIALDRLRTEQEIAKIMKDERLSPEAREALANRERQIQTQREGVEKLGESLKMLRDINQAVFQNMTDALTNFIMTGKLNFRNFAATVLMEIARINAAAVAAQASRGIMGVLGSMVGSWFSAGTNFLGSQALGTGSNTTFGINPSSSGFGLKAGGGDILGNQPVVVGDAGPELFIPRNAGTIVPNSQLANSMGGNTVTNYYIDAIDTKSFEERVLQSHNAVWAANQYANKSLPLSRGRA